MIHFIIGVVILIFVITEEVAVVPDDFSEDPNSNEIKTCEQFGEIWKNSPGFSPPFSFTSIFVFTISFSFFYFFIILFLFFNLRIKLEHEEIMGVVSNPVEFIPEEVMNTKPTSVTQGGHDETYIISPR